MNIAGTINERLDVILPLVRKGATLDMGIVDSRRSHMDTGQRLERKPNSLFSNICKANSETLSIDIDEKGIEILASQGFNVQVADAVTMQLGRKFDAIVAGDIIEHLPNVGQFLSNMRDHLTADGTLVITTPNPFYTKQRWKIWRRNRPQVHEEHTCWFDPITLSYLCKLSGLEVVEVYRINPKKSSLLKTWQRYFRNYFSQSFMVLAKIPTEDKPVASA